MGTYKKRIDLAKILADTPEGTVLYSVIEGDVLFCGISKSPDKTIKVRQPKSVGIIPISRWGKMHRKGECILFPSKDNRDWSTWVDPVSPIVQSPHLQLGKVYKTKTDSVYAILTAIHEQDVCINGFDFGLNIKYFVNKYKPVTPCEEKRFHEYIKETRSVMWSDAKKAIVRWVPQQYDWFYYINDTGGISKRCYDKLAGSKKTIAEKLIENDNCFYTEEIAKKVADIQYNIRKLFNTRY